MTTPRLRDPDGPSSVFLVERYLPPAAAENLAGSVSRAAQLCTLSAESAAASTVQYLHSAYLPTEDTCFCLFRAATADAVRALNDEADFALDRITAAVLLYPTSPAPGEPRSGQTDMTASAADQFPIRPE
ncbi:MAG TPA: nickel-binding protein [Streptosporangiaceae bacterium]|nr:nickel-binding protein [Streptosporangiaceae bacterium]